MLAPFVRTVASLLVGLQVARGDSLSDACEPLPLDEAAMPVQLLQTEIAFNAATKAVSARAELDRMRNLEKTVGMDAEFRTNMLDVDVQELLQSAPEVKGATYLPHVFGGVLGKPKQMHSQIGQDWLVMSMLGCRRNGFYIDLAANDAIGLSNTLMPERDFGFDGICIEVNPAYLRGLQERRCDVVQAAVGSPAGQKVNFTFDGVYGGIVGEDFDNVEAGRSLDNVSAKTTTVTLTALSSILESVKALETIDYLSLDVEGAESLVMSTFPWDRHKIKILTVERPKEDLKELLSKNGYKFHKQNSGFQDMTYYHESFEGELNFDEESSCMLNMGYPRPVDLQ